MKGITKDQLVHVPAVRSNISELVLTFSDP